jgi:hypothetical protein
VAQLEARADGVCLGCHRQFSTVEAQRAHTHHAPDGAGGRCLGCHMPKKNMSLDNRLTRYHRIGSPTESAKVLGDRPLECSLCHPQMSVESLVSTMEAWWHKRYDRARLRELYGDLDGDPLAATLLGGKPHEQAVALALLGEARQRRAAPLMAAQLTHPIPILRYYAQAALEAALGAPAPFDVHAANDEIVDCARRWLAAAGIAWSPSPAPGAPPPSSASPPSPATITPAHASSDGED